MRWCPKKLELGLPALAFFPPYLLHDFIGDVARWLRPSVRMPFFQGRNENAPSNQPPFLLGKILDKAGHDPRHRLPAVAHHYLFAVSHELDVGAELRFQVANIHCPHRLSITDMTKLVISGINRLKSLGQLGPGPDSESEAQTRAALTRINLRGRTCQDAVKENRQPPLVIK